MPIDTRPLAIVWLKRDLRLRDHQALSTALAHHKFTLLLYIAEPSLRQEAHSSARHFNFIKQSIADLNQQLMALNTRVLAVKAEVIPTFEALQKRFAVEAIYTHMETGIDVTFRRDKNVMKWCQKNNILFREFRQQGVFRALQHRKGWIQQWTALMNQPQSPFPSKKGLVVGKRCPYAYSAI